MKAVCPFDKNHILLADQLENHIKKCKSPQRINYEQCKYNTTHYVLFNQIKQHEKCTPFNIKECAQNQTFNSQVTLTDDSVLMELCQAMSGSKIMSVQQEIRAMQEKATKQQKIKMQKDKRKKKIEYEEEPRYQMWKQPSFRDWIIHEKEQHHSSDEENSSVLNFMQYPRRH